MLDLFFGHAPGQLVIGFAIAQVKAGFQLRAEAIANVGGDALAAAAGVVLIAIGVRVGQRHVVVEVAQHLPRTDLTLLICTACFITHLQRCSVVAGVSDVVD